MLLHSLTLIIIQCHLNDKVCDNHLASLYHLYLTVHGTQFGHLHVVIIETGCSQPFGVIMALNV